MSRAAADPDTTSEREPSRLLGPLRIRDMTPFNLLRLALTAPRCVDTVVTDLALLTMRDGRFRLDEVARGFTVDEVLSLTGMAVAVADPVGTMQDNW